MDGLEHAEMRRARPDRNFLNEKYNRLSHTIPGQAAFNVQTNLGSVILSGAKRSRRILKTSYSERVIRFFVTSFLRMTVLLQAVLIFTTV